MERENGTRSPVNERQELPWPDLRIHALLHFSDTLSQLIPRRWRTMNRDHTLDVELRHVEPVRKVDRNVVDNRLILITVEQIALKDELLLRQIGDQHLLRVRARPDVEELDGRRSIGEDALAAFDRLPLQRLRPQRQRIGIDRERALHHLLEERLLTRQTDHRHALSDVRPDAPSMIVMMIRQREIMDGLVRKQL